jgi:hypothetical protein
MAAGGSSDEFGTVRPGKIDSRKQLRTLTSPQSLAAPLLPTPVDNY